MRDAGASAAPLRLGGYQGPTSILTRALTCFAEHLGAGPAGLATTIEQDVTAHGETARSLFDSVEAGRREVCYMASGYLAARVPELGVLDLPFAVHDRAKALEALDGEVGRRLREAVASRTGLQVLAFWDNGFRHLSNGRRPLRHPDDCRGLTVRTLDSADYLATLSALGFTAVVTDVRELRQAVASGRVDAQENPLTNFLHFELWRHHRHVSLTGHLFGVALLACHRAHLESLPRPARERVHAAAVEATTLQRRLAAQEDVDALARLRDLDVEVLAPPEVDIAAMAAHCEAHRRERRAALPEGLVESYLQPAPSKPPALR